MLQSCQEEEEACGIVPAQEKRRQQRGAEGVGSTSVAQELNASCWPQHLTKTASKAKGSKDEALTVRD